MLLTVLQDSYDLFELLNFPISLAPSLALHFLFGPVILLEIWEFDMSVIEYTLYAMIGIFYFLLLYVSIFVFHLRHGEVRRGIFKSVWGYIMTHKTILGIIFFGVIGITILSFNYILFKLNYPDLTYKEYNHCIITNEIKTDFPFRMSEKSICIHDISCKKIGLTCEHDNTKGWRVAKNITKDNFDFRYIQRDEGLALPKNVLVYILNGEGFAYITTKKGATLTPVDFYTFEYIDSNVYRDSIGYFIRDERVTKEAAFKKLQMK